MSICIYYIEIYIWIEVIELRQSYVYKKKYTSLKILSIGIYFADHSIYIVCVDYNGFLIYLLFVLKLKE